MRRLLVIGIGAGDPGHLTLQAAEALGTVDVFFLIDKPNAAPLAALRDELIDRHGGPDHRVVHVAEVPRDRDPDDYGAAVADWHARRAQRLGAALHDELADDQVGAILVWGDPSLYDSTLRLLDAVDVAFDLEVLPGITSVQALAARHRRPLHGVGEPVVLTTGRRVADEGLGGPNTVVLLDGQQAFETVDPATTDIWWGAYLGTPDEVLVAGPLAEVADEIAATRAAAREANGWIMDVYLLRRRDAG
jgi:precorrin-6A synthase